MSRKYSFKLTLSNNVTEKQGVNYLIEEQTGFFKIDKEMKKELLDRNYSQAKKPIAHIDFSYHRIIMLIIVCCLD